MRGSSNFRTDTRSDFDSTSFLSSSFNSLRRISTIIGSFVKYGFARQVLEPSHERDSEDPSTSRRTLSQSVLWSLRAWPDECISFEKQWLVNFQLLRLTFHSHGTCLERPPAASGQFFRNHRGEAYSDEEGERPPLPPRPAQVFQPVNRQDPLAHTFTSAPPVVDPHPLPRARVSQSVTQRRAIVTEQPQIPPSKW